MGYGTSLGTAHEDEISYVMEKGLTDKQLADQAEINSNSQSGDFQSRFYATDQSTMPLEASRKLTDALKQTGSTKVPENSEKVKRDSSQDIYVNPWVTITPEDIDTGMNVAMSAGPGTMVGVRSIDNLTGAAKNEALSKLGHAQVLEANGIHPDEITKQTGFSIGAEGRWKTEIDDSVSNFDWGKLTTRPIQPLSKVLDHPDLYKAIPALKDVKVIRDPGYPAGGAAYEKGSGPGGLEGARIRMGTEAAENHGILMHEVQHAIQEYEGFAKGGAPRKDPNYLEYHPDMQRLKPEIEAVYKKLRDPNAKWTAEETERKDYLVKVALKYAEYTKAAHVQASDFYHRLAGEVESKNVDTRLLMTAEERKRIPPQWSEDTPRSRQIVIDEPAWTSAYGIVDKGRYIKP